MYQMGAVERRFADLIWYNEPIPSPQLVILAAKELNWQKATTYTILKKLCDKGIFVNSKAIVTSLISRDKYYAQEGATWLDDTFKGSLPVFLTALCNERPLKEEDIAFLRSLIDEYEDCTPC